jgi:hypothetical protein
MRKLVLKIQEDRKLVAIPPKLAIIKIKVRITRALMNI